MFPRYSRRQVSSNVRPSKGLEMFEGIWSYIWPDNIAERCLSLILLPIFILGCIGPFQIEAQQLLIFLYYIIPLAIIGLFWLLVVLKQLETAFSIEELLSPLLFYGIIFSAIYWRLKTSDNVIFGFIPISGRFVFGSSIILVTGASHFLQIKTLGLKKVAEQERPKFSLIPRAKTLSYFSETVGEWGLMFLSIIFIAMILIAEWPHIQNFETIFPLAILVLFPLSSCLLSLHRTQSIFWLLLVLFVLMTFFGVQSGIKGLPYIFYEIFLYILFGLSVVFPLEKEYHHVVLVVILLLHILIQRLLESIDILGSGRVFQVFTTIAVPFLAAAISAYLATRWAKIQVASKDGFLPAKQVAHELSIPISRVYRLLQNGKIIAYKIGGTWYVKRTSFDKYKVESAKFESIKGA